MGWGPAERLRDRPTAPDASVLLQKLLCTEGAEAPGLQGAEERAYP
jgi:hypothetical protein